MFRADHVGSLLRPPELLQARSEQAEGRITVEQLRSIEDQCVLKALGLQRDVGISVFTEGEYRRAGWSTGVREAVDGLVPNPDPPALSILGAWQGPSAELANASVTAMRSMVAGERLRAKKRLVGEEAAFLKRHAPGPWKITMPGPLSVAGQLFKPGITDRAYRDRQELAEDIAAMQRQEIAALKSDGVSYIQLDSLHYVERVADTTIRARMIESGEDPDAYLDELIALDNSVLATAHAEGVTVGLHMCRGNNRSAWHAEGAYDPIAEKAFSALDVDRFLLEYDTERAGGFEPLRFVPRGRMVVLGLISSKLPALESHDDLRRRIDQAAQYVPFENLAISPQCGFASTAPGNLLTWDEMKRKLELVVETARRIWG
ncbi:MAG TPA: cobalamin-independent methionine synthase II family protein [Chloroflexota bacterium]|nr:cobalamin-independent methionine synthase II family protein [Chloroflexota bacterium]